MFYYFHRVLANTHHICVFLRNYTRSARLRVMYMNFIIVNYLYLFCIKIPTKLKTCLFQFCFKTINEHINRSILSSVVFRSEKLLRKEGEKYQGGRKISKDIDIDVNCKWL